MVSGDRPMCMRVKYLVIMELTIATLFVRVFVMRPKMSCYWFLCFSSRLTCRLLKNHKIPPAALLLHTYCPSEVPVKFHNYSDSLMRVAGKLQVPTMHSRDFLLQAKDGSRDVQAREAGPVEM
jgi:hypothetical protein